MISASPGSQEATRYEPFATRIPSRLRGRGRPRSLPPERAGSICQPTLPVFRV